MHRRIKIGFPSDLKRTTVEEIAVLAPNETVTLPVEIMFPNYIGKIKELSRKMLRML
jgi:hypothetical protein